MKFMKIKRLLLVLALVNVSSALGFDEHKAAYEYNEAIRARKLNKSLMQYKGSMSGIDNFSDTDQPKLLYYKKLWNKIRLLLEKKQMDPELELSELDQFKLNVLIRELINNSSLINCQNTLIVKFLLKKIGFEFADQISLKSINKMSRKQRCIELKEYLMLLQDQVIEVDFTKLGLAPKDIDFSKTELMPEDIVSEGNLQFLSDFDYERHPDVDDYEMLPDFNYQQLVPWPLEDRIVQREAVSSMALQKIKNPMWG